MGFCQWKNLFVGLGKEQCSVGQASHNVYFFQDPFAGNMADLQSSNTGSVSHALFIELQLEVPQDWDSQQNHSHC